MILHQHATPGQAQVFGPVPSPLARIKDRYRYQCMVKFKDGFPISSMLKQAMDGVEDFVKNDKLLVSADIDPYNLM